jgi:hypothetical protein
LRSEVDEIEKTSIEKESQGTLTQEYVSQANSKVSQLNELEELFDYGMDKNKKLLDRCDD